MLEAEQKADDAMQNLTMTSVIKLAQTGLGDKDTKANKPDAKSSQSITHKSEESEKHSSPNKDEDSQSALDKEMEAELGGDYDRVSEKAKP